ncbi:hypothetical protein FDUTEX481_00881 [Tolypothrix sp. PCC 7601]|nr:hypothetical protein FDUTEX481_00881 [Tolypothrix sp. PCC 7601]
MLKVHYQIISQRNTLVKELAIKKIIHRFSKQGEQRKSTQLKEFHHHKCKSFFPMTYAHFKVSPSHLDNL